MTSMRRESRLFNQIRPAHARKSVQLTDAAFNDDLIEYHGGSPELAVETIILDNIISSFP